MYIFDAATGAVIGFVVPGGIRLIGRTPTTLDNLATYGLTKSDMKILNVLTEQAPVNAIEAQHILASRGLGGRVSKWWLDRRGLIVGYRGQTIYTGEVLSPMARKEGLPFAWEFYKKLRSLDIADDEIRTWTAKFHDGPVPLQSAGPGLANQPLGAVGIPTTTLPGIASGFAKGSEGVVYVIRMPKNQMIRANGWQGLKVEYEHVVFNEIPSGSIVRVIPAKQISPLTVNERGQLVPGWTETH
jgi:hypothetical protein